MTTHLCLFPDCGRKIAAKQLCATHYGQAHAGRPLTPIKGSDKYGTSIRRRGFTTCAVPGCERPDKVKEFCGPHYQIARNYKVSAEEIGALLNGEASCDICGGTDKLVFDHAHACCPDPRTNSKGIACGNCNRGILCNNCNTALGMVKESPETLTKMIDYLQKPRLGLAA